MRWNARRKYTRRVLTRSAQVLQPTGRRILLVGTQSTCKWKWKWNVCECKQTKTEPPRYYDPTGGRILLGGADFRDIDLATLHARTGVVSQDTQAREYGRRDI